MLFIFASTFARAARSASFDAARTRSASISGSSGSIAFGSIRSSLSSPLADATTVTMPPPAEASAVSLAASSCICCICSCISCACFMSAFMSKLTSLVSFRSHPASSFVQLPRVEGALHQLEDVLLARGRLLVLARVRLVAQLERDGELAAGHLVERVAQHRGVLRILGQFQVERGRLRKGERQRVTGELRRVRLRKGLADRDRALLDRGQD